MLLPSTIIIYILINGQHNSPFIPSNSFNALNLIGMNGLSLLSYRPAKLNCPALPSFSPPFHPFFSFIKREELNEMLACRAAGLLGFPFRSSIPLAAFFSSTNLQLFDERELPSFHWFHFTLFWMGWLLLCLLSWAEPLAVPPPITPPIQTTQPTNLLHFKDFQSFPFSNRPSNQK